MDARTAQEFAKNGVLHLRSFVEPQACRRLIVRMCELVERGCKNSFDHFFEAGEDRQTVDDFFLASAKNISFFFDKNALAHQDARTSNFTALNKVGHALHQRCPVYQKFSHHKKNYELMHLLGQKKPTLVQSMFIFKQRHFGDEVPPHQDSTFLYTEPDSVIGLWYALEDADERNGCLWVQKGGHRGPLKTRFVKHGKRLSFEKAQRVEWPMHEFTPMPAKAGDVIVLHGRLPHFSKKNLSAKTRYAYTLHFIDRACHYPKTNWLDISHS